MSDVEELPVPNWGLRCPHCDAPLAGAQQHRCTGCGEPYNIRQVLGAHRPIPDIELFCPECDYSLTGLTGERCPECGSNFSVREMLEDRSPFGAVDLMGLGDPGDHHVRRRDPTFTGAERPLPELGLSCSACDEPLAGALGDVCPDCGKPFNLFALLEDDAWADVTDFVPATVRGLAKSILYGAQIPYLIDNARLREIYGGRIPFVSSALRVPKEFFFDALYAFAEAAEPAGVHAMDEWVCPSCNETVPGGFEVCWNCNAAHPDQPVEEAD